MGLVSQILGLPRPDGAAAPPPPRGIAEVEAALSRLDGERRDARQALDRAKSARSELLLVDGSDKQIADLDADSDRHRLTLERCDKLEPLVRAELQSLQSEARRRRWQETSERYDAAARIFAGAFRVALEKWQSLIAMRGEALCKFTQTQVGGLIVPPAVLTEDFLHRFEAELDRQRDFAARPERRRASRPLRRPGSETYSRQGGLICLKGGASPPRAASPPQLDPGADGSDPRFLHRKLDRELARLGDGPVPKGRVGIRLLKSDIDIGDGDGMRWRGDEIAVPELQARRLVENNAAEYIPAPKSAPPAAAKSDGRR